MEKLQKENRALRKEVSVLKRQKLQRHELTEAPRPSEELKEGTPASFSARSLQGPSGLPSQERANEGYAPVATSSGEVHTASSPSAFELPQSLDLVSSQTMTGTTRNLLTLTHTVNDRFIMYGGQQEEEEEEKEEEEKEEEEKEEEEEKSQELFSREQGKILVLTLTI